MEIQYSKTKQKRMAEQNAQWEAMTEEERTTEMVEFQEAEQRREHPDT